MVCTHPFLLASSSAGSHGHLQSNTSHAWDDAYSDALFNCTLRTRVPTHINPVIVNPAHQVKTKVRMACDHDVKRGVHPLPLLCSGIVRIETVSPQTYSHLEHSHSTLLAHTSKRWLARNDQLHDLYSAMSSYSGSLF